MFEPTRFAQDALRLAYAALVPTPTKRLPATEQGVSDGTLRDEQGQARGGSRS